MSLKLFITGTDTHIGKTYFSVELLKVFNRLSYSTLGLKPIASGCYKKNGLLVNPDALALSQAASVKMPYQHLNPFSFEPAIAPHIAAKKVGMRLTIDEICKKLQVAFHTPADIYVIEGVGGWQVPLNEKESMPDLVKHLNCQVVLVVGIKLGCLNHAILTAEAIKQSQSPFLGWVANCIDPTMDEIHENIDTLKNAIDAPYLGCVPFMLGSDLNLKQLASLSSKTYYPV